MASHYGGKGVLVTGAQGFIGAWLAEHLLDCGARVVCPRRDLLAQTRFLLEGISGRCDQVDCDLCDYGSVVRVLNEYEISAVFHLAAQTIVNTANRSPLATYESNVRTTYVLLEACRALVQGGAPIERVVVASSDKAYGAHDELPYREDTPLEPRFAYDVSKACCDMIARSYAASYGLPVAVVRCANVYGGGDFNFSRIVPDTARALIAGHRPVIRSDGSPRRDLVYIRDVVEAYSAVADSLSRPQLRGRAWNVGTGEAVSVREIVDRLIAISGRDVEPVVLADGPVAGEIDRQYLDATAARDELGWAPRFGLDRGLTETFTWYRENLSEPQRAASDRRAQAPG